MASDKGGRPSGLEPLAHFVSLRSRGVPPEIMGIGPIGAIPAALKSAGLTLADMGWMRLNEAFAAQALAVIGSVGLNPDVVNPMGGAIAWHPLCHWRDPRRHGRARAAPQAAGSTAWSRCAGTGQGAAGIPLERRERAAVIARRQR